MNNITSLSLYPSHDEGTNRTEIFEDGCLNVAKNNLHGHGGCPKSLYRRYLEVSEATFQALLKTPQVIYTITSPISISHRLIKALRDVCHAISCNIYIKVRIVSYGSVSLHPVDQCHHVLTENPVIVSTLEDGEETAATLAASLPDHPADLCVVFGE